jgi:hypothetical protein
LEFFGESGSVDVAGERSGGGRGAVKTRWGDGDVLFGSETQREEIAEPVVSNFVARRLR